jgi:glycosyltransferase involved in cell wall biosynthesis
MFEVLEFEVRNCSLQTSHIKHPTSYNMRILALEPYYGGSHKAFLDGWSQAGRHEWTILPLPAYKWKWRMRHAAVTFADQVRQRLSQGSRWDLLFCSDMLNLAEFLGLAPQEVRDLPSLLYFHENQLTYPVRVETERDYQFGLTNMTSALAAGAVWFNSAFHRDSFLHALAAFLNRMPDYQTFDAIARIRAKSEIFPPGVNGFAPRGPRKPGPLRILWAARWEHDKNPEEFFEALTRLKDRRIPFRISVIGEQFREVPEVFAEARRRFADHIDRWGYQQDRAAYEAALLVADVFVSTAAHEFFGLSAVEATLAGAYPLVPRRLAYPEVFELRGDGISEEFLYEGGPAGLADRLADWASRIEGSDSVFRAAEPIRTRLSRFEWHNLAPVLDDAMEQMRAAL